MVKRIGSFRKKARNKLTQKAGNKGKLPLRNILQTFNIGDRVSLKAEPSFHKGLYHMRFHGLTGVVMKKKGSCYEVTIKNGNKEKLVVVHPVHLIKV